MALDFSAEFGRNTPTGASWYNRAAWAAIHPTCLTLSFSLSPPTPVGLSLYQSFPLLCLSGLGPAGFIRGLLHSTLPGFVCCTFFDCFMWSAVHPWTLTHIFLAFLQPCNWLLIKQSMCPLYSFPSFFFFFKLIFVSAASFLGSNCLQSLGGNEFSAL